jgi:hypothetical protein
MLPEGLIYAYSCRIRVADSWYMKKPFVNTVLKLGFHAIGQVRSDTALYGIPIATGR